MAQNIVVYTTNWGTPLLYVCLVWHCPLLDLSTVDPIRSYNYIVTNHQKPAEFSSSKSSLNPQCCWPISQFGRLIPTFFRCILCFTAPRWPRSCATSLPWLAASDAPVNDETTNHGYLMLSISTFLHIFGSIVHIIQWYTYLHIYVHVVTVIYLSMVIVHIYIYI